MGDASNLSNNKEIVNQLAPGDVTVHSVLTVVRGGSYLNTSMQRESLPSLIQPGISRVLLFVLLQHFWMYLMEEYLEMANKVNMYTYTYTYIYI